MLFYFAFFWSASMDSNGIGKKFRRICSYELLGGVAMVDHPPLCLGRAQSDLLLRAVKGKAVPLVEADGPRVAVQHPQDDGGVLAQPLHAGIHQRVADALPIAFLEHIQRMELAAEA